MNVIRKATAGLIYLSAFAATSHAVSIDWVTVDNPGNPADMTGYGAVPYEYRIGKYEITNAQYVEFLNAVAKSDTKGLFPNSMITGSRSGIVRGGTLGNLTYSVKPTAVGQGPNGSDYSYEDKPVFYVSLLNAMRFVNWLENGQPKGFQNLKTTEDGVYLIGNGTSEVRKPNATYFIPSEDEWYKAAYHKNDGASANYWAYPTGTDSPPDHNLPVADTGDSANFHDGSTFTTGNTLYPLTDVGAYLLSSSPYGTYDQGGNVWEWTESHDVGSIFHATRGGSWSQRIGDLHSSKRSRVNAFVDGEPILGFRVASIPEPSALILMLFGAIISGLSNRRRFRTWSLLLAVAICGGEHASAADAPTTIRVDLAAEAKPISGELFGIFFEDINFAADGGLYGELVQNRSFEYRPTERANWGPLSEWEVVTYGGGKGTLVIDAGRPLHPNNPHYAGLDVPEVGDGVGIGNRGFDGIVIRAGETYDVSLFARQLYVEKRWGGRPVEDDEKFSLTVRLEDKGGESLGEKSFDYIGSKWQHLLGEITATGSSDAARLVVLTKTQGGVALDVVSLFPRDTFRGRKNGLRKDLAETIAALEPKFVRFPGGCLVHGNGLANMYRWKDTIGPIHERREQSNLWGYHQTVGLGYYEYFQFCEDIGAEPVPVVPAAVCCQNSGLTAGAGQEGLPLDQMPSYIQEVLDLVEWANGPATSTWGAKRAAAGHPEPFNLKYLGVGNEDRITPEFEERFKMINDAIREKHPEITVIGTSGPFPDGPDFEDGWRIANRLRLPMVDEHYYRPIDWFLSNLDRYDKYDRGKSHVYLGEYAAHEPDRRSTLRSALAEAAYMTHLERNGDVVRLSSYAPLLAKRGHTQWNPDLIYFSNTEITPTINYYVQQLFGANSGDEYLNVEVSEDTGLATSCVRDSKSGDVILKIVNVGNEAKPLTIELAGGETLGDEADCSILSGDPLAVSKFGTKEPLAPRTKTIAAGKTIQFTAEPHSLSVVRLRQR